jgi:hypothetical protein
MITAPSSTVVPSKNIVEFRRCYLLREYLDLKYCSWDPIFEAFGAETSSSEDLKAEKRFEVDQKWLKLRRLVYFQVFVCTSRRRCGGSTWLRLDSDGVWLSHCTSHYRLRSS